MKHTGTKRPLRVDDNAVVYCLLHGYTVWTTDDCDTWCAKCEPDNPKNNDRPKTERQILGGQNNQ